MCGILGLKGQTMNATQCPFLSIKGLFSDSSNWKISPRTFKPWSPLFYDPFADLFAPQSSLYNSKLCTQRALNWGGIYRPFLLIWLFCYALTHSIPECGLDFPVAQSGLCLWTGSQTQDLWGSYQFLRSDWTKTISTISILVLVVESFLWVSILVGAVPM